MEFLRKYYNPKNWEQWFKEASEDFGFSFIGNLLPFWAILVSNLINKGVYDTLFLDSFYQPFTMVVLSGTFLTSAFYLQSKPRIDNKVFKYFYTITLIILGLLIAEKSTLEDECVPNYLFVLSLVIFLLCFMSHTYFLYLSHYVMLNINPRTESKKDLSSLEKEFDKIDE